MVEFTLLHLRMNSFYAWLKRCTRLNIISAYASLFRPTLQFIILLGFIILLASSCSKKNHFAAMVPNSSKSGGGGMGMTYKNGNKSKPAQMNVSVNTAKKKEGSAPGAFRKTPSKVKRTRGFAVFERSRKKRKPEMSLFPSGVTNKYRLHESHVSDKKALRMLKKEEKKKAKEKKEKRTDF